MGLPSWVIPQYNMPLEDWLSGKETKKSQVEPRKAGAVWRASELGSMCPRQEALCAVHGISRSKEIDVNLELIFAIGHGVHDAMQQRYLINILVGGWRCLGCGKNTGSQERLHRRPSRCDGKMYDNDTGELVQCPNHNYDVDVVKDWHLPGWAYRELNVRSDSPFKVYCHPDGLVWRGEMSDFPEEGVEPSHERVECLEIKSASNTSFYSGSNGNAPARQQPFKEHIVQVQTYLNLLGMEYGRVLYVNKSGFGVRSTLVSHLVQRDPALYDEVVVQPVLSVEEAIKTGDVSGTRRACSNSRCARAKSCPVAHLCFGDVDGQG